VNKFIVLILFPVLAYAYIPSADFIFTKMASNSGKGFYQIQQEVNFSTAEKLITVTESWWISNDGTLFLKASGPLYTEYFLYKNGKKYFFNAEGKLVSSPVPKDFYENLFFYRTSNSLKESLIKKQIVPAQILKKRPVVKNQKDLAAITSEPYLKLAQVGGSVVFLMGPVAQDDSAAGIWVDQDRFMIKKLRFPSRAELYVDGYSELSRGLIYPKTLRINWENNSVTTELSRGDALQSGTEFFQEPSFAKLSEKFKPIPTELSRSVVADFYKRFR